MQAGGERCGSAGDEEGGSLDQRRRWRQTGNATFPTRRRRRKQGETFMQPGAAAASPIPLRPTHMPCCIDSYFWVS